MNGIVTRQLFKSFGRGSGERQVLRSFSFFAPSGTVTLLAGVNGAGKTTWLRVALGMVRPTDGTVVFDGRPVGEVRREVSVVFDEPPVYPHMSGRLNLRVLSGCGRDMGTCVDDLERILGLDARLLSMKAGHYSIGQRRRLAIGAALLRRPKYLFLDEPTAGLDPGGCDMLREALHRTAVDGASVILTGHDFDEAAKVVDRVVVLHEGVNVFEGTPAELAARRPPRVRVVTRTPEAIQRRFQNSVLATRNGRVVVIIPCETDDEAESVVAAVQHSSIPLEELSIERDDLEQSFLALVGDEQEPPLLAVARASRWNGGPCAPAVGPG
jgi:ABC-2 type transport system ATP-binding protein